jgi:iron complex outermembrane recepter protein
MKLNNVYAAVAGVLSGVAFVVPAHMALAQQEGLEEIVVTATRRAQDLQEVPVSIVAITGEGLETRGLQSLEDVGNAVPNINIQGGGGGTSQTQFRMRGIPGVGTYIDGVWQVNTNGFLTQEFVDVDRIEILRGPQGTRFGRDSLGGSIRIWTKRPEQEFSGNVTATVGSLDRRDVKASVNIPFTDKLSTKWTLADLKRDGYIQSLNRDQKNGDIDQQVLRGDVLWEPTDKTSVRFQMSDSNSSLTEPRIQDGIFNTAANMGQALLLSRFYELGGLEPYEPYYLQAGYPGGLVGKWENRTDVTLPTTINNQQTSLDIQVQLSDALKMQFLTADYKALNKGYFEWDNSPHQLVNDFNLEDRDVLSEEVQFSGDYQRFHWVAGLYYWDQKVKSRGLRYQLEEFAGGSSYAFLASELGNPAYNVANLPAVTPGQTIDIVSTVFASPFCQSVRGGALADCESLYISAVRGRYDNLSRNTQSGIAYFGGVTFELGDKMELNVGLRQHSQDNSDQNCSAIPGVTAPKPPINTSFFGGDIFACTPAGTPLKNSFDKVTGNVSLQRKFTNDFMGYVSYSEGFDSGGISAPTIDGVRTLIPYTPQTLNNTEVGIRSDLAGGKLRFNATVFLSKWEDIQNLGAVIDSRGIQLPTLVTQNVGTAEAKGIELEMTYLPTENLLLNFNIGNLDTHYTYIKPGTFALSTATAFQQAPEDTYNVGVQYTAHGKNGGDVTARVEYSYSSQYWRSLPFLRMDAYSPPVPPSYDESGALGNVNARVTFRPASGDWEASIFGTNLTNEYQLNSGFFHGIWGYDFATVGRPREAGVTLTYRF